MANFWDLSDGDDIAKTGGQFEVGGGKIDPIPNDTTCTAIIDEAKWDTTRTGENLISLRWSVLSPTEYKNRKIFQKLWVSDPDPKAKNADAKRDKAKRMLAAVDSNAGGKLLSSGKMPTDESMSLHLVSKPMNIKVMQWTMENEMGEKMSGNWISAVSPKNGIVSAIKNVLSSKVEDDNIPF